MAKKVTHPTLTLPVRRTAPPRSALGRWFFHGDRLDEERGDHRSHPWYLVLWLTGVDYFSTLGYQPGIALLAAGALSPLATAILVAVTLLGALPIYAQVALRSYVGQGSIAMLEHLLSGWRGKLFVLILLGFAGTDFVITMTLSAADAAQHALENPYLHPYLGEARLGITIGLLALLALVFLKGLLEAIGLAATVAIPYLLLNLVVLFRGLGEIVWHPTLLAHWRSGLSMHGDWTLLILASALIFPKLALGLSGFETGVSVMPLVSGDGGDGGSRRPLGRIRATRKLLAAAALIMSGMLLMSSFVTTLLIPEEAFRIGGPASGRAIAYLAHRLLGNAFGTLYDLSTIAILWFAGASAMAGLLSLIPRYLPRFGMAPRWVSYRRPLVVVLFAIDVIVTLVFDANVEAQGGAYATGVLVLMLSAAVAVALALWRESRGNGAGGRAPLALSLYFWLVSAVFGFTLVANVIERPDGVIIASAFIAGVIVFSALSRYQRATELRVSGLTFVDDRSAQLWQSLVGKKVNLVPLRTSTVAFRSRKAAEIRKYYAINGPSAFVHINLLDNRSEFFAPIQARVTREEGNFVIEVSGAVAIANTIAYISELIDPISIFLGLTRQNLMAQSLRYLLWGEGEIGLMVYTILLRYWEWTPEEDVRPLIFLMSE
ncbi:MAG: hypothetical protein HYY20_11120 [Candidatus Tectomicrobia bacterium]|uniref:Amino acid transporter n=1 Tax=Tectimicrobiota bacterium TaxID=2528274 RepID=A0A932FXI6_UNCTE|nr:hypothetical protein [Candidatus Tectomicrobia bacterium]